ncbi:hypothetical protein F5Y05DRAFT_18422 [Hypoxylon sp. FL0543]|nr:hypothetical protein F5Y05DRAFT_18422 [Hypoxylon sp. FL0543]
MDLQFLHRYMRDSGSHPTPESNVAWWMWLCSGSPMLSAVLSDALDITRTAGDNGLYPTLVIASVLRLPQDPPHGTIAGLCRDRPHVKQTFYLLRGLFVHRILIIALKKRYGVQYGLHPLRDPVAVPLASVPLLLPQPAFAPLPRSLNTLTTTIKTTGVEDG